MCGDRGLHLPLEELIRLESVKGFEQLYEKLKMLHSGLEPWDEESDMMTRKRLVVHLQ